MRCLSFRNSIFGLIFINLQVFNFILPLSYSLNPGMPGSSQLGFATNTMLRLREFCTTTSFPSCFKPHKVGRLHSRFGGSHSLRTIRSLEFLTAVMTGVNANVINGKEISKTMLAEARIQCDEIHRYVITSAAVAALSMVKPCTIRQYGTRPGLAVVIVGSRRDSQVCVIMLPLSHLAPGGLGIVAIRCCHH
jgi:hypothetical protein